MQNLMTFWSEALTSVRLHSSRRYRCRRRWGSHLLVYDTDDVAPLSACNDLLIRLVLIEYGKFKRIINYERHVANRQRCAPSVDCFLCVPLSHPPFSIQSGCKLKPVEGSSHYQRCSSERLLLEEQPSWLDDLLDVSEPVGQKYHRRTASDTSAYLDKTFDTVLNASPSNLQTSGSPLDPNHVSFNRNPRSFGGTPNKTLGQTSELSRGPKEDKVEKPNQLGSSNQNQESHGDKNDNVQSTCAPKADPKRAKTNRQSANRSRVRKLQYIAELERNVQALQAEGSGFVAEI